MQTYLALPNAVPKITFDRVRRNCFTTYWKFYTLKQFCFTVLLYELGYHNNIFLSMIITIKADSVNIVCDKVITY